MKKLLAIMFGILIVFSCSLVYADVLPPWDPGPKPEYEVIMNYYDSNGTEITYEEFAGDMEQYLLFEFAPSFDKCTNHTLCSGFSYSTPNKFYVLFTNEPRHAVFDEMYGSLAPGIYDLDNGKLYVITANYGFPCHVNFYQDHYEIVYFERTNDDTCISFIIPLICIVFALVRI